MISIQNYGRRPGMYPYHRPETSFLLDGENGNVIPIQNIMEPEVHQKEGVFKVNDILHDSGLTLYEDRIPVVAYGANVNPDILVRRFKRENLSMMLPVIKGETRGFDVVHGAYIPKAGSIPAQITHADAEIEVWLNLLDEKQIIRMHGSESLKKGNYFLGLMLFIFEDGSEIMAYGYFGGVKPTFFFENNNGPVAFASSNYTGQNDDLRAGEDFVPINVTNREFTERAQCEIRDYISQEVFEKFGFDLYDKSGEIPDEIKETDNLIKASDFISKEYGVNMETHVEAVEDPYILENLKTLKDLV